jgi:thiosulfate/3-mercaptopyruvate sulfurtransferase
MCSQAGAHATAARNNPSGRLKYLDVEPNWLADHLLDSNVKVVQVDLELDNTYVHGHIPGAHLISWNKDLTSEQGTDILSRADFERLMSRIGADPDTVIVIYTGSDELLAVFAFWIFHYYGHESVKLLPAGTAGWIESGKPLTTTVPNTTLQSEYHSCNENSEIRPNCAGISQRLKYRSSEVDRQLVPLEFIDVE